MISQIHLALGKINFNTPYQWQIFDLPLNIFYKFNLLQKLIKLFLITLHEKNIS